MMLPRENTLAEHIEEAQVAKQNARAQSALTRKLQEDADYWQDKLLTSVEMLGEVLAHLDPDIDPELCERVETFLEEQ